MNIFNRQTAPGFVCGVFFLLLLEFSAGFLLLNSVTFGSDESELPADVPPMTRLGDLHGTFTDLQGKSQTFADLRGKVVLMNVWATWCPPCRAEMPSLESLWKLFASNDQIRILCISDEALEDVRVHPFVRTLSMPLHVFATPIPEELNERGVPRTYIFDREGRAVFMHTGMAQWDDERVVSFLKALLANTAG